MTAVECAIEKWKLERVALCSPVEESVVATKLSALGRTYSRDVLALYAITGGMEDGYSDAGAKRDFDRYSQVCQVIDKHFH